MAYIDRIDFTDEPRCARCHRTLRLGIAHIVVGDDHFPHAYGPSCAKLVAPGSYPICDFTKGALYEESEIEDDPDAVAVLPTKKRPHSDTRILRDEWTQEAIVYVRLRQERMKDFPRVPYKELEDLYERIRQCGTLDHYAVERVHRLMGAVERSRPLLTARSLQTAYAYRNLLSRVAHKLPPDRRKFLQSLVEDLRQHLMLTENQIRGANRWLAHFGSVRLAVCPEWLLVRDAYRSRRHSTPDRADSSQPPAPVNDGSASTDDVPTTD